MRVGTIAARLSLIALSVVNLHCGSALLGLNKTSTPLSLFDAPYTEDPTVSPIITWQASGSSGSASYEVCIGSTPGACDVVGWTNVGPAMSAQLPLPNLPADALYFASVRSLSFEGVVSSPVSDQGFAIIPPPTFSEDYTTSAILSPHWAVSRASGAAGSFYDASGILRFAPANALAVTENFLNAKWVKTNTTLNSGFQAPTDLNSGTKAIATTTNGNHTIAQTVATLQSATSYTFSCFVKPAGLTKITLGVSGAAFAATSATFDLSLLALATTTGFPTGTSFAASTNGWYRLSVSATASASATATATLQILNNSGAPTFAGNGTDGIEIWGAQLENSPQPTSYIPNLTTTAPAFGARFDHDPSSCASGTCASRGLLFEPQRANIVLHSQDFAQAWIATNAAVSAGLNQAPDSSTSSNLLTEVGAGTHAISQSGLGMTISSTSTASVFVKPNGRTRIKITVSENGSDDYESVFDLVGKGKALCQAANGTALLRSADIIALPNGWYRVEVSGRPSTTLTSSTFAISLVDHDCNSTYTADGTSGVSLFGAQFESGYGASSYIPTTTASSSRSVDNVNYLGISDWYDLAGGTFAIEDTPIGANINESGFPAVWRICDSSVSCYQNTVAISLQSTQSFGLVYDPSTHANFYSNAYVATRVDSNIALRFVANNLGISTDGDAAVDVTSAVLPNANAMQIAAGAFSWSKSFKYWTTPLSDAQLAKLTTHH